MNQNKDIIIRVEKAYLSALVNVRREGIKDVEESKNCAMRLARISNRTEDQETELNAIIELLEEQGYF